MLKITGVQKTFNPGTINEKKALCGIDLTLNEGDFVTVIGGNGAGKSTMLNMIAGVYPVDCGSIVIDGKDVTKLPEYKRAKFIGRVFQDPMTGTAADMQIAENLAIAARRGKGRTLRSGVSKKEKVQYAEMLKGAGSGAGYPPDLQGGSAQRRSAPGGDPVDGHFEEAEGAAAG